MKINNIIKGALAVLVLAGTAMVTGCSCSPVREELVTTSACPITPIAETRTIRTLAPVAEGCNIPVETSLCD